MIGANNGDGQVIIRVPEFVLAVRVGAVVAELAHAFLHEVLAHLGLVVVVRNVQHLHVLLNW